MFITKLDGEIIYFSPLHVDTHDQSHWNELELHNLFLWKSYGVMGDGSFTFNRKSDCVQIHGYKPFKRPARGSLSEGKKGI